MNHTTSTPICERAKSLYIGDVPWGPWLRTYTRKRPDYGSERVSCAIFYPLFVSSRALSAQNSVRNWDSSCSFLADKKLRAERSRWPLQLLHETKWSIRIGFLVQVGANMGDRQSSR